MPKLGFKGRKGLRLTSAFNGVAGLPGDLSYGDRSFALDGEPQNLDPRAGSPYFSCNRGSGPMG
jgi:hypothetical protein